ncbi:MAG: DUF5107 domain-containing protein [Deltaproteobacteria bacterium]|nr:DUF5107 domain-containing protein [Deltaproteobacteria bacterium]
MASTACTTTGTGGAGNAGGAAAGGGATGGSGQVATGGSGGLSSTTQSVTGGGPGAGGAAGDSSATGAAGGTGGGPATGGGRGTGGASAGGVGAGGVGTGGRSSGGAVTGGGGGAGSGGRGTGGVGTGGKSAGGAATGGRGGAGTGGVGAGGAAVVDSVTRTASTFAFKHFPIQTNANGVWNGPTTPGTQVTTTTYDTVVLENGYLKVTLLPDYGGRVLSIVHKPTGRELLYQNPIGTPYLMLEGIFYYDYLVILGGIFPGFPEPEHGKYWNQPYELKVVSESKDAITVRMSRKDDLNLASGVPAKYDVGRTDVLVETDVTLRAGSTSLELVTKLTNTQAKTISKFEYWTNTTLAPGSAPGKTAIPLNTRILAVMDKVHLLESDWSWFGSAEERVSGEIFKWKNLAYFKNWVDQGIAYANPDYRANWSGLMNDDNSTGVIRVSDNVKTPGLKLWTFGRDSVSVDINDSTEWLRPTIEMWHGVTPEFWTRGTMSANEVRQWSDSYFPTLGMKEITAASAHGALCLSSSKSGTDTVLNVAATLTVPDQTVKAILRLGGSAVAEQDVVVAAAEATTVSATVASSKASSGTVFEAEFLQGDRSLLSGKITLP